MKGPNKKADRLKRRQRIFSLIIAIILILALAIGLIAPFASSYSVSPPSSAEACFTTVLYNKA